MKFSIFLHVYILYAVWYICEIPIFPQIFQPSSLFLLIKYLECFIDIIQQIADPLQKVYNYLFGQVSSYVAPG